MITIEGAPSVACRRRRARHPWHARDKATGSGHYPCRQGGLPLAGPTVAVPNSNLSATRRLTAHHSHSAPNPVPITPNRVENRHTAMQPREARRPREAPTQPSEASFQRSNQCRDRVTVSPSSWFPFPKGMKVPRLLHGSRAVVQRSRPTPFRESVTTPASPPRSPPLAGRGAQPRQRLHARLQATASVPRAGWRGRLTARSPETAPTARPSVSGAASAPRATRSQHRTESGSNRRRTA